MNFEAGTQEILALLLGEGKAFERMDQVLRARFIRVLYLLSLADDPGDLAGLGSLKVKFFDGHYQLRVDGEKRLWFEVSEDGTAIITHFGSTDHKRGKKR